MSKGKKNSFKSYRVYAKVMNPYGRDYFEIQGEADDQQRLYRVLAKVRKEFSDTFEELDRYVYVMSVKTDGREKPTKIVPSRIILKYEGEEARELDSRIRRCEEECYYYIDPDTWRYCHCLGKKDCEKFVNIDVYLATHRKDVMKA